MRSGGRRFSGIKTDDRRKVVKKTFKSHPMADNFWNLKNTFKPYKKSAKMAILKQKSP